MRRLAIVLVALFALSVVATDHAEASFKKCPRMRLYVVTGFKVEPQFRVYARRITAGDASCRTTRSVIRRLNRRRLMLTKKRRASVWVSGRGWDCLRGDTSFITGDLPFECEDRGGDALLTWRQPGIAH